MTLDSEKILLEIITDASLVVVRDVCDNRALSVCVSSMSIIT